MSAKLHTFLNMFNTDFEYEDEVIQLNRIIIPIIQRDYAQGRKGSEITRIRERFLKSLYNAVINKPITLDFIYGDINSTGDMTPLDGQQRLTTLFLLHWYAAKKENIDSSEYEFLKRFSYETRYSARQFCRFLVNHQPSFLTKISDEIIDQPDFPLDWKKDATISSMLVMIDAIHEVFDGIQGIWKKLEEGAITFFFLPVKDMGLTDELYIKMNSRGKPLTQFEHFKAEFEHELRKIDHQVANRIIKKIDLDWTDMLWEYRGWDDVIDDEFLRYFRFVCDVICYKNDDTPQGKEIDEFSLIRDYFAADVPNVLDNIELLENYFDVWVDINGYNNPDEFFNKFLSYVYTKQKALIDTKNPIDLFGSCLRNYANVSGNGNRLFPLNRIILLYAFVIYLSNKDSNEITEEQFERRLRIVNNLIKNSDDEISDSSQRTSGNRMPAILRQVDSIICEGVVNEDIERNFNTNQIQEETSKLIWTRQNPAKADSLFELEDHKLLYGQISILGIENDHLFERFHLLFDLDYDTIDCVLHIMGEYYQREQNNWRYQFGSSKNDSAWQNLFHKSGNKGYEDTKDTLVKTLSTIDEINILSLSDIIDDYLRKTEQLSQFDWKYYYIKYKSFRPGSYGKYYWSDKTNRPYELVVLQTRLKVSESSYNPYLYEANDKKVHRPNNGTMIVYDNHFIISTQKGFDLYYYNDQEQKKIHSIIVAQNEEGIDTENRVEKLREFIKNDLSKYVDL